MSTFEKLKSILKENEYFVGIPEYFYDCKSYEEVIQKCCLITNGVLQLKSISCQKNEKSFEFNLSINNSTHVLSLKYTNDFIDSKGLVREMNSVLINERYAGERYFCDLSPGVCDFGIAFSNQNQEHEMVIQDVIYRDDQWLKIHNVVTKSQEKWHLEQARKEDELNENRPLEVVELVQTTSECFIKVFVPTKELDKVQVLTKLIELIKQDFAQQILDYNGKITLVCTNGKMPASDVDAYNELLHAMTKKPTLKYGFLNLFSQDIYISVEHESNFIIDIIRIDGRLSMIYKRKNED
jgi:hypothetical protein